MGFLYCFFFGTVPRVVLQLFADVVSYLENGTILLIQPCVGLFRQVGVCVGRDKVVTETQGVV